LIGGRKLDEARTISAEAGKAIDDCLTMKPGCGGVALRAGCVSRGGSI
jgi:hypothetical protein